MSGASIDDDSELNGEREDEYNVNADAVAIVDDDADVTAKRASDGDERAKKRACHSHPQDDDDEDDDVVESTAAMALDQPAGDGGAASTTTTTSPPQPAVPSLFDLNFAISHATCQRNIGIAQSLKWLLRDLDEFHVPEVTILPRLATLLAVSVCTFSEIDRPERSLADLVRSSVEAAKAAAAAAAAAASGAPAAESGAPAAASGAPAAESGRAVALSLKPRKEGMFSLASLAATLESGVLRSTACASLRAVELVACAVFAVVARGVPIDICQLADGQSIDWLLVAEQLASVLVAFRHAAATVPLLWQCAASCARLRSVTAAYRLVRLPNVEFDVQRITSFAGAMSSVVGTLDWPLLRRALAFVFEGHVVPHWLWAAMSNNIAARTALYAATAEHGLPKTKSVDCSVEIDHELAQRLLFQRYFRVTNELEADVLYNTLAPATRDRVMAVEMCRSVLLGRSVPATPTSVHFAAAVDEIDAALGNNGGLLARLEQSVAQRARAARVVRRAKTASRRQAAPPAHDLGRQHLYEELANVAVAERQQLVMRLVWSVAGSRELLGLLLGFALFVQPTRSVSTIAQSFGVGAATFDADDANHWAVIFFMGASLADMERVWANASTEMRHAIERELRTVRANEAAPTDAAVRSVDEVLQVAAAVDDAANLDSLQHALCALANVPGGEELLARRCIGATAAAVARILMCAPQSTIDANVCADERFEAVRRNAVSLSVRFGNNGKVFTATPADVIAAAAEVVRPQIAGLGNLSRGALAVLDAAEFEEFEGDHERAPRAARELLDLDERRALVDELRWLVLRPHLGDIAWMLAGTLCDIVGSLRRRAVFAAGTVVNFATYVRSSDERWATADGKLRGQYSLLRASVESMAHKLGVKARLASFAEFGSAMRNDWSTRSELFRLLLHMRAHPCGFLVVAEASRLARMLEDADLLRWFQRCAAAFGWEILSATSEHGVQRLCLLVRELNLPNCYADAASAPRECLRGAVCDALIAAPSQEQLAQAALLDGAQSEHDVRSRLLDEFDARQQQQVDVDDDDQKEEIDNVGDDDRADEDVIDFVEALAGASDDEDDEDDEDDAVPMIGVRPNGTVLGCVQLDDEWLDDIEFDALRENVSSATAISSSSSSSSSSAASSSATVVEGPPDAAPPRDNGNDSVLSSVCSAAATLSNDIVRGAVSAATATLDAAAGSGFDIDCTLVIMVVSMLAILTVTSTGHAQYSACHAIQRRLAICVADASYGGRMLRFWRETTCALVASVSSRVGETNVFIVGRTSPTSGATWRGKAVSLLQAGSILNIVQEAIDSFSATLSLFSGADGASVGDDSKVFNMIKLLQRGVVLVMSLDRLTRSFDHIKEIYAIVKSRFVRIILTTTPRALFVQLCASVPAGDRYGMRLVGVFAPSLKGRRNRRRMARTLLRIKRMIDRDPYGANAVLTVPLELHADNEDVVCHFVKFDCAVFRNAVFPLVSHLGRVPHSVRRDGNYVTVLDEIDAVDNAVSDVVQCVSAHRPAVRLTQAGHRGLSAALHARLCRGRTEAVCGQLHAENCPQRRAGVGDDSDVFGAPADAVCRVHHCCICDAEYEALTAASRAIRAPRDVQGVLSQRDDARDDVHRALLTRCRLGPSRNRVDDWRRRPAGYAGVRFATLAATNISNVLYFERLLGVWGDAMPCKPTGAELRELGRLYRLYRAAGPRVIRVDQLVDPSHECWSRLGARAGDYFLARDGSAYAEMVTTADSLSRSNGFVRVTLAATAGAKRAYTIGLRAFFLLNWMHFVYARDKKVLYFDTQRLSSTK